MSNISEFEVSVLKLNGRGHHAHYCSKCGAPIHYRSKSGLCHSCSGRQYATSINRDKAKRAVEVLDKEFLMKGVCPKCHKKGSLHKRWVKNGVTEKRYSAYYFGHYDAEKQNVRWCYVPKKTALLYLTPRRASNSSLP